MGRNSVDRLAAAIVAHPDVGRLECSIAGNLTWRVAAYPASHTLGRLVEAEITARTAATPTRSFSLPEIDAIRAEVAGRSIAGAASSTLESALTLCRKALPTIARATRVRR